MNQRFFISLLCVLALFVAGCGGAKKPPGMPALHKTTLTFTQDGTPLAGATVTLAPQDAANSQWPAGGTTNDKGVLQVRTMADFNGVPAGTYKITVSKTESEGTATTTSSDEGGARSASGGLKMYHLVDKKYQTVNPDNDLILEVKSGTNAETFDLGPAIRELIPVFRD